MLSTSLASGNERREEGMSGGRRVLTISQVISTIAIQPEVMQLFGQLTTTEDLGLAGGKQAAEQIGQGQPSDPCWTYLSSGSPAPSFHVVEGRGG